MDPGKLFGVDASIVTALKPEFVIITDCELFGRTPSDQFAALSQRSLVGFIQEFTWANTEVEVNESTDAAIHTARPIAAARQIIVWNRVFSLSGGEYFPRTRRLREGGISPT